MDIDYNIISTITGGVLTGCFSIYVAKSSGRALKLLEQLGELRVAHKKVLLQLEAYHTLEGFYATELESRGDGKALHIKAKYRDLVANIGFVRPTVTAKEARERIEELGL